MFDRTLAGGALRDVPAFKSLLPTLPAGLLVPLLHIARRQAARCPPASDAEQAGADVLSKFAPATLDPLAAMATTYFEQPRAARARSAPPALVDIALEEPLTAERLALAERETAALARPWTRPVRSSGRVLPPAGPFTPGARMRLLGDGFGGQPSDYAVRLYLARDLADESARRHGVAAGLVAVSAGMLTLELPDSLPRETDLVVEVMHRDLTMKRWRWILTFDPDFWFPIKPPPPPDPRITKVTPLEWVRASDTIRIDGTDLAAYLDGVGTTVHIEALQEGAFAAHIPVNGQEDAQGWRAELDPARARWIELRLGFDIIPGYHTVSVSTVGPGGTGYSDRVAFEVTPWRYTLRFTRMVTLDESNEASSADELVTAWVAAVDDEVITKTSKEYGSMDVGDSQDYTDGDASPLIQQLVRLQLVVVTRLVEWDDDSKPSTVNDGLQLSAQLAGIVVQQGGTASGIAFAIGIVGIIIAAVVEAFEDPDDLGQQTLSWTAEELLRQTLTPDSTLRGSLPFNNADSEGSHVIHYELTRSQ